MRQPFQQRLTGLTDAGTAVTIALASVKPGRVLYLRQFAVHNGSGESVTVSLGFLDSSTFVPIWALQTVADADAYGAVLTMWVFEGQTAAVQITGTSKKGAVDAFFSGDFIDLDAVEVVAVEPATPQAG